MEKSFVDHIHRLQEAVTGALKKVDPEVDRVEDLWTRRDDAGKPGGGGRTRAFSGRVIEKAGVSVSEVHGFDPRLVKSLGAGGDRFWAAGLSAIIHPRSPRIPTVHANFRLFKTPRGHWFGGGADLTPYYPHREDFFYFHKVWRQACRNYYPRWKKNCDEYFVNHHRGGEMRGIGGIFFDHFNTGDPEKDLKTVEDVSNCLVESYFPIAEKRKGEGYTEEDVRFQMERRGRYVEFNLIHDRGTRFGLESKGRTESVFISLPPRCRFTYRYQPEGVHREMMDYYRPRDWGRA